MHAGCPGARANGGGGAAVGVPGGGAAVGVPALACEAAGEEKAEIGSSMEEAKEEIASGLRSRASRASPGPEILVEVSVEVGVVGGSGEAAGAVGVAGRGRLGDAAAGGARAWRVWTPVPPAALEAVATRPVPSGDAAGCAAGPGAGCWRADCAASSAADSTSSERQSGSGTLGGTGAMGTVLESSEAARDRREEPRGAAGPSQGGRPPVALRALAALAAGRSSVGGQVLAVVEGEEPG